MGWHAVNCTTLQQCSPGHGLFCAVQARTRCLVASLLSCTLVWCAPLRCWAATSWAIWQNSGLPSMQERAWSSMHNPEEQVTSQSLLEGAWRKVTHCFGTLQMKSFYTFYTEGNLVKLRGSINTGESTKQYVWSKRMSHQSFTDVGRLEKSYADGFGTLKNKLYFVKPLPEIWVALPG